MTDETNPWQSLEPQQPYQSPLGQPYLPPMTNSLPSYQSPLGQPYPPPQELRKRYTPDQIRLYFYPFPDRGSKIRELQQKRGELHKLIAALVIVVLILVALLIGFAKQGITYIGLLEFICIIGIVILITWLVKTKLNPLNEELRKELASDAREKEIIRKLQPPNERQYDEWISDISSDIYKKAPHKLRLHEHPEYRVWRQAIDSEHYGLRPQEPEKFGASLNLEGRSDEVDKQLPQLQRQTHSSLRMQHYTIYAFTILFITEDSIAIYTSTVNLRDATRDSEEFEYGYLRHLSHMSLKVDTTRLDAGTQLQTSIAFTENNLLLTFDSGHKIMRNISALHIGDQSITNQPITKFSDIHEKLTKALIDHERSMIRSIEGARDL
jgi:uncharacterized membrane protein (DUF485 family)